MGSGSDLKVMGKAAETLEAFGVEYEMHIISAHREADVLVEYCQKAADRGIRVLITGAGLAAALGLPLAGIGRALGLLGPALGLPLAGIAGGGAPGGGAALAGGTGAGSARPGGSAAAAAPADARLHAAAVIVIRGISRRQFVLPSFLWYILTLCHYTDKPRLLQPQTAADRDLIMTIS